MAPNAPDDLAAEPFRVARISQYVNARIAICTTALRRSLDSGDDTQTSVDTVTYAHCLRTPIRQSGLRRAVPVLIDIAGKSDHAIIRAFHSPVGQT